MNRYLIALSLSAFLFTLSCEGKAEPSSEANEPPHDYYTSIVRTPYQWRTIPGNPDQIALYKHGLQIGNYKVSDGFYYPIKNKVKGPPAVAPVPPPFLQAPAGANHTVFGVTGAKREHRERFSDGNREITRADVVELLGADLADDSKAGHVTVIAKNPATVKAAAASWEAFQRTNANAAKIRAQFYEADAAPNKAILACNRLDIDTAFQKAGVVVLAQAPGDAKDGRSTPRAWYQAPSPELFAEALRNVNPDWTPNLPKFPNPLKMPDLSEGWWLVAAGAVLGLLVLLGALFN